MRGLAKLKKVSRVMRQVCADTPRVWVACKEYRGYRAARENGYLCLARVIGSRTAFVGRLNTYNIGVVNATENERVVNVSFEVANDDALMCVAGGEYEFILRSPQQSIVDLELECDWLSHGYVRMDATRNRCMWRPPQYPVSPGLLFHRVLVRLRDHVTMRELHALEIMQEFENEGA